MKNIFISLAVLIFTMSSFANSLPFTSTLSAKIYESDLIGLILVNENEDKPMRGNLEFSYQPNSTYNLKAKINLNFYRQRNSGLNGQPRICDASFTYETQIVVIDCKEYEMTVSLTQLDPKSIFQYKRGNTVEGALLNVQNHNGGGARIVDLPITLRNY